MKILTFLLFLLTLSSCVAEKKEEEDERPFLFPLGSTTFKQVSFKQLDGASWFSSTGSRQIQFDFSDEDNPTLKEDFFSYKDIAGTCSGFYEASMTKASQGDLVENPSENPVIGYNVFTPYPDQEGDDDEGDDVNDAAEVYIEAYTIGVSDRSIDFGGACSMIVYNSFGMNIYLYKNGDLIIEDYGRNLKYFFKPL